MSIPSNFSYKSISLVQALQDLAVRFIINAPQEDVEKPEVCISVLTINSLSNNFVILIFSVFVFN